jgi:hypothetical protein
MILINQQESKNVYFYLTPQYNQNYLFKFISNDTGNATYMMATNSSLYNHYQKFLFVEGGTNSLAGGFDLIEGTYDYEIWETFTQSLTPSTQSTPLAVGLMTVGGGTGSCYIWKDEPEVDFVYYEPCPPAPAGLTGS